MRKCFYEFNIRKFVIGSGGSAFSDGGFGAVQAMQVFRMFDEHDNQVSPSENPYISFDKAFEINRSEVNDALMKEEVKILLPCDVQSPLLGKDGSAYVFGPQKGARPEDLELLDNSIEHIVKVYL